MNETWLWIAAGLVLALVVYFLPTIVASERNHREQVPIFVLNLLLGWSFVGWVVALVWSLTSNVEPPAPSLEEPNEVDDLEPASIPDPEAASRAAFLRNWLAGITALQRECAMRGQYFTEPELVAYFGQENVMPPHLQLLINHWASRPLTRPQWWGRATGWSQYRLLWHERGAALRRGWKWIVDRTTSRQRPATEGVSSRVESDDNFAPPIPLENAFDDLGPQERYEDPQRVAERERASRRLVEELKKMIREKGDLE